MKLLLVVGLALLAFSGLNAGQYIYFSKIQREFRKYLINYYMYTPWLIFSQENALKYEFRADGSLRQTYFHCGINIDIE